ncbi:MAG: aminopeptidase P N-terminal domain-containing protein [Bacteroidetes bacterium]|nr:aminopeptidase P N-terminal domain-containing protein [Bacteroidota bacterium]
MRYPVLNPALLIENRKRFIKHLKPKSIAVFNANDYMPTNADGTMPFRQNSDLFYLTGVTQEETILLIFPDAFEEKYREVLFLRETNEKIAVWEGQKLTKEKATEVTGIKTVLWLQEFETIFNNLMSEAYHVYLNTNEHLRARITVETRDSRFINWCKAKYPLHCYERLAPVMHRLRAIKSPAEVELVKTAIGITGKAFRRIIPLIKPGIMEYKIEAELSHEFTINHSRGHAYEPIIASGFNACVLHYNQNENECKKEHVLLLDFGAEYGNYASDLTRCLPVSGRFTKRQKDVYNAVLRVLKQATKLLVPGTILKEYNDKVGLLVQKELVDLKLLSLADVKKQEKEKPQEEEKLIYKKYYPHKASHFLGLDVHDVGLWTQPIQAGMIFTCEPGIYIRKEKLGIRLENDILVTKNEPVNLMESIPIEAEEIEELMNSGK